MEPVHPYLLNTILDNRSQYILSRNPAAPQFSHLLSTDRDLHAMEVVHPLFEPAPQTSHSIIQEQMFCSYQLHQDPSAAQLFLTPANMLMGNFDYVRNNQPIMYNPFPGVMIPFQSPMTNPTIRGFPAAVYPNPWSNQSFLPCGAMVWDGLTPVHFNPMIPGNPCMINMNMGFLPPSPQFRFSSGPCMLVNMPEFRHEVYLPPQQSFCAPEGRPSWCQCPPMAQPYQACRPSLDFRRDKMVLNGAPTLEDKPQTEEHQVFTPDRTKEQGSHVFSEPLVALQDSLQTQWIWEEGKDVPSSICTKADVGDRNCLPNSNPDIFDNITVEDIQSLIDNSLEMAEEEPLLQAQMERIIQFLLSDAPLAEYEENLPAKEEPNYGLESSFSLQRSAIEEQPTDRYWSIPLDKGLEEDMTHKDSMEVDCDEMKRCHETISYTYSLRKAAKTKDTANEQYTPDPKSKTCIDFRFSQGNGYALNAGEMKPPDGFTAQRNSQSKRQQREQGSVRRRLFRTEQTKRTARATVEQTLGQKDKKYADKRRESKAPKGKLLSFCSGMVRTKKMLQTIQEEPTEEEMAEISKVPRRKPQSRNTHERGKKEMGLNANEGPDEPLLPQSLTKKGRTRENRHGKARASKKTNFSDDQSVKSKRHPNVDGYNRDARKAKHEAKTKKTPARKTAEQKPDSFISVNPGLSRVHEHRCSEFVGDRKVSKGRGNGLKGNPGLSPRQFKHEKEEQLDLTCTTEKHQRKR